jgi:hypothetical protein
LIPRALLLLVRAVHPLSTRHVILVISSNTAFVDSVQPFEPSFMQYLMALVDSMQSNKRADPDYS